MKVTFFSNFLNHHQLPFCLEMVKILGDNFKFVATTKIDEERILLGYEDMNKKFDFVVRAYENEEEAKKLGYESDFVIIGSAPVKYIKKRLKDNKITFRYSERIFKSGFNIKAYIHILINRSILERNNVYLLCSSAYASWDYNLAGAYVNKCYKWGYFPETIKYDSIKEIIIRKKKNSILWVARFLEWKHPEVPIEIAKKLKENKIDFELNIIGSGKLEKDIRNLIKRYNLDSEVKMLGTMSPEQVRQNMLKNSIFLFTSDRNEGWGAVLNEAMNSGCAIIANNEIGSVPFLIEDKKNGLIYEDKNIDDLFTKIKDLLSNKIKCETLGTAAYQKIINEWNAKVATQRFLKLANELQNNKESNLYISGPCSKAKTIKYNWYKH